jgi:hypothetical protein
LSAARASSASFLDHELKSEYQRWLHAHDKDRDHYDGHPDRTDEVNRTGLKRANEILRKASAFFAQPELDRRPE